MKLPSPYPWQISMRTFNAVRSLLDITRRLSERFQEPMPGGKLRKAPKRPVFRPQYELLEDRVTPATRTWTGLGTTNDWSEAANWSGGVAPGATDLARFNSTSTKDAVIDASFAGTISQLQINSGYTGTVTLDRSLTLAASFTQADGSFDAQGNTLAVSTSFAQSGGTFGADSGTITVGTTFTQSGGDFDGASGTIVVGTTFTQSGGTFDAGSSSLTITNNLTKTGGTFDAGTGTVTFNHSASSNVTHTINIDGSSAGSITFHNLVFGDAGTGTKTYTISSGDTLNVLGDYTVQSTGSSTLVVNTGTIAAQGNVIVGAGANGGTAKVQFANTSADQEYVSTGGLLSAVEIANGTRTVSAASGTTDLAVRSLTVTSGNFEAGHRHHLRAGRRQF